MINENKVSIWLKQFRSEMDLMAYVEQKFNEDGDVTSFFMEDFKIGYYNHDFQEALFCESENNSPES